MKLGMQVRLGPANIVLDGDPAPPPPKGHTPNFRHISVAAKWLHGSRDVTWYGTRPRPRRLCVRWGPRSPSPKKGAKPPKFLAYVYYGQTAGWIKMVLGMEIGLSPGDFVLNGDPARPLNFRPMFIIVIVISLEHCTGVRRYWFVQVPVQV